MLPTSLASGFSIKEATVQDLQLAFQRKQLTSRQLVEFYLKQIKIQNPVLKGVLEVNPDALAHADRADQERRTKAPGSLSGLHGIPILVKDTIATKDKLNTYCRLFCTSWISCAKRCRCCYQVKESWGYHFGEGHIE
jgi:amidase